MNNQADWSGQLIWEDYQAIFNDMPGAYVTMGFWAQTLNRKSTKCFWINYDPVTLQFRTLTLLLWHVQNCYIIK